MMAGDDFQDSVRLAEKPGARNDGLAWPGEVRNAFAWHPGAEVARIGAQMIDGTARTLLAAAGEA